MYTVAAVLTLPAPILAQQRPLSHIADDLRRLANELDPPAPPIVQVASGGSGSGSIVDAATMLAATGGIIELQPGVTYSGPVLLPARAKGLPEITIRTAGTLPNRRIDPADARMLATIAATDTSGALRIENTAGYRIDGVRLKMTISTQEVVVIQDSDNITLDRVLYCPGEGSCVYNSSDNVKRAVRLNGRHLTVTRSYLNAGPRQGQDNQAILSWEGSGPYTITNNTLMAGGENILFGGADNLGGEATNPADILIDNNLLYKPQEWRAFPGSVKNSFELKNATRVIFSNNVIDGCWPDAQAGWAIMLTPVNQDGRAPWTVLKDVVIERNILRNSARGISLVGYAHLTKTQQTSGLVIRKNVFETYKAFMQVGAEVADVTMEGNVIDNAYTVLSLYVGGIKEADGTTRNSPIAIFNLQWTNNVQRDTGYGVYSEVGIGTLALNGRTQTWNFTGNKFTGLQYRYPTGTTGLDEATFQAAKAALLAELGR